MPGTLFLYGENLYKLGIDKINEYAIILIGTRFQFRYKWGISAKNFFISKKHILSNIKSTDYTSEEACQKLLNGAHIFALAGNGFGLSREGYTRLAISIDRTN